MALLRETDSPDIECCDTGETIEARVDYERAKRLSANAMGAFYTAHGYHYVLCFHQSEMEHYVIIMKRKSRDIVGRVTLRSLARNEVES